jgi:hypothetical protein
VQPAGSQQPGLNMYSITVKIDGIESKRRSAGLLHIVTGFFLIAKGSDYYRLLNFQGFITLLPIFAVAGISLFYGFFRRKVDVFAKYNSLVRVLQIITFLVLGIAMMNRGTTWDYVGLFLFAFLCFLLLLSEKRIFKETTLFFDEKGVMIPGNYKDHLVSWEELTEVIIREDFLTLFHVKKKYLQYQVMQDLSTLEVAKINAFCREQIEKAEAGVNKLTS